MLNLACGSCAMSHSNSNISFKTLRLINTILILKYIMSILCTIYICIYCTMVWKSLYISNSFCFIFLVSYFWKTLQRSQYLIFLWTKNWSNKININEKYSSIPWPCQCCINIIANKTNNAGIKWNDLSYTLTPLTNLRRVHVSRIPEVYRGTKQNKGVGFPSHCCSWTRCGWMFKRR